MLKYCFENKEDLVIDFSPQRLNKIMKNEENINKSYIVSIIHEKKHVYI